MEWVTFSQLAHGKWEQQASGKIRYSPKYVEIHTDDQPLIEHFKTLRAEKEMVSNLVVMNNPTLLIGGKFNVDMADGQQILLKPAGRGKHSDFFQ